MPRADLGSQGAFRTKWRRFRRAGRATAPVDVAATMETSSIASFSLILVADPERVRHTDPRPVRRVRSSEAARGGPGGGLGPARGTASQPPGGGGGGNPRFGTQGSHENRVVANPVWPSDHRQRAHGASYAPNLAGSPTPVRFAASTRRKTSRPGARNVRHRLPGQCWPPIATLLVRSGQSCSSVPGVPRPAYRLFAGSLPRFHLMLQPTLARCSCAAGLPASTASTAARRSRPFSGLPLPGRLSSSWPR